MEDSKIKVMIESDGVIQMLEKRVETISDDGWKKIIEDFRKLHENEERMERQLEIEELQKTKEDVRKAQEELQQAQVEFQQAQEEADKKVEQMIYKMYEDGFSFEQISNYCSLSVDELKSLIKS